MKELRDILTRARTLEADGTPAAVATLVAVEGSSYRREGARMLLETAGTLTGVLSGGCLESDLLRQARDIVAAGAPRLVHFDLMADEEAVWGFGLGCAGRVTLLVEPLAGAAGDALERALAIAVDDRHEVRMATRIEASGSAEALHVTRWLTEIPRAGAAAGAAGAPHWKHFSNARRAADERAPSAIPTRQPMPPDLVERLLALPSGGAHGFGEGEDGGRWLLESILPPVHLVLVGAGRDGVALARLAHELGWEVTVVDPRPTDAAAARFAGLGHYLGEPPRRLAAKLTLEPRVAMVLATHRYLDDLAVLGELASHEGHAMPGYLAVLGPRSRRTRLLDDLAQQAHLEGHSERSPLATLRGPAGLALGGRSPEEVALAIVAEIQATLSGHGTEPLSAHAMAERSAGAEVR